MDFNTRKTQDQGKKSKGLLSRMAFWRDDPAKLTTEMDEKPTGIQPAEKPGSMDVPPFTPSNSLAQSGKDTQDAAASPPLHQISNLGDNGEEVLGTLNPHSAFINIFTGHNLGNPDKSQRGKKPDNAGSATFGETADAGMDYGVKSSSVGGLFRAIPIELSDSEQLREVFLEKHGVEFPDSLASVTGPGQGDPERYIALSQEECDAIQPGMNCNSVYMTEAEARNKAEVIQAGERAESMANSLPDVTSGPAKAIPYATRLLMDLPIPALGRGPKLAGDAAGVVGGALVNAIENETETGEFNVSGAVGDAVLGHVVGKGTGGSDNTTSD